METRTTRWSVKALAALIMAALILAFVPALAFPASAATKYKTVRTSNYKVKLPSGKSWTRDVQTIDLNSADGAAVSSDALKDMPSKADLAYAEKELKNGAKVVSFVGMKSKQKVKLSDLNSVKKSVNSVDLAALINQMFNGDETYSSLGTLNIKSIKAKTVKVKKYKKALKVTIKGSFTGEGYNISAKMTVYVTAKKKHVLAVCAAKIAVNTDGSIKIVSGSSERSMAKKVLQSVKIR